MWTPIFQIISDNEWSPSRVPSLAIKLCGEEKYHKWRFEAELAPKYYRALSIVKRITTEPAHLDSPLSNDQSTYNTCLKAYNKVDSKWEDKTDWATIFLFNNISEEVKNVLPQAGNLAIRWKALEALFELQTVTTVFITFPNLISLHYSPETLLKKH